jgi:hypothetical protein
LKREKSMLRLLTAAIAGGLALTSHAAIAAFAPPVTATPASPSNMLVEIYRIAPGQHEGFMRLIALFDEANRRAGLPPRQLYVHQDGAGWDFMLIQPAETPDDKRAALADAYKALNLPAGANFFVTIRRFIAEHSDNFVSGPTTAADWLTGLEAAKAKAR